MVNQHGLAGERLGAGPEPGCIEAVAFCPVAPAPFVLTPAVLEFAQQQIGLGAIGAGADVVRIDGQRFLELLQGFVEAVLVAQRYAKVDVSAHKVRLACDSLAIGRHLVVVAAHRAEQIALVVMHLGKLGMAGRETLEVQQRPFVFTGFCQRQRGALQRRPVIGQACKAALVERRSVGVAFGDLADVGGELKLVRRRIQHLHGACQIVRGALMFTLLGGDIAEPFERLAVLRIEGKNCLQQVGCFAELSSTEFLLRRGEQGGDIATHTQWPAQVSGKSTYFLKPVRVASREYQRSRLGSEGRSTPSRPNQRLA